MLGWGLLYFVFATVAGIFGFTGIATGVAYMAKIFCVIFGVLFMTARVFPKSDSKRIKPKMN